MMKFTRRLGLALPLAVATLALAPAIGTASEQPLRILVPYAAGGSADVIARILAEPLKEQLGRTVIVENRPGAGGRVALLALKSLPADGNSVVLAFSGVVVNSIVFANAKEFDFKKDFVGLAQIGRTPLALAVPYASQANNAPEFVKLASNQGHFSYGNNGTASFSHLAGLRFAQVTQLKANPISYQGGAPMANDLMGGQIEAAIDTMADWLERHKGKKVKVLGAFSAARSELAPDIPTMAEQGIKDTEAELWMGFLASSKVSPEFREKFQQAVKKSLEQPAAREKIAQKIDVQYKAGDAFAQDIAADFETWTPVIAAAGLVNPK